MPRGVVISRDTDAGFPIGTMPSISENQFNWLTYRMGLDNDDQACLVTEIDLTVVDAWKEIPDFAYAYEKALENKREGFKYLITQLNGKALRVINDLLDGDSVQGKVHAVNLLMRAQALLIDRQNSVDIDAVSRLIESLKDTSPVLPVSHRRRLHSGR